MAKSSTKRNTKKLSEATTKGKLVELIVGNLHRIDGVEVEQNVLIPPKNGSPKRRREVDVLVHSNVAGYPFKIAIECKNYKKIIGVGLIDEFRGKLDDIGLSPQQGIYVTTRRFTKDAVDRAERLGIRLLLLSGLSEDRLTSEILKSVHSVIYLLCGIAKIDVKTDVENFIEAPELENTPIQFFCNEKGETSGVMPHEIWSRWVDRRLPIDLGDHVIELPTAPDWFLVVNHRLEKVTSVSVTIHVAANVTEFEGKATLHGLWNQPNNDLSRIGGSTSFTLKNEVKPIRTFHSEESLSEYITSLPHAVKSLERVLLPRIWSDCFYWPVSVRLEGILKERREKLQKGEITNIIPQDQNELEGTDLSAVWDEISTTFYDISPV